MLPLARLRRPGFHELPMGYSLAGDWLCCHLRCPIRCALEISQRPPSAAPCDLASLVAIVPADLRIGCGKADLERLAAGARRQAGCKYLELLDRARLPLL